MSLAFLCTSTEWVFMNHSASAFLPVVVSEEQVFVAGCVTPSCISRTTHIMWHISLHWGGGLTPLIMGRGCMRNTCHGSNGPTPGQRNPSWFLGRSFGGGLHLLSVWPKTSHLALLSLLPHLLSPGKHLEETCGVCYLLPPAFAQWWCWTAPEHNFKIVHLIDIYMNIVIRPAFRHGLSCATSMFCVGDPKNEADFRELAGNICSHWETWTGRFHFPSWAFTFKYM